MPAQGRKDTVFLPFPVFVHPNKNSMKKRFLLCFVSFSLFNANAQEAFKSDSSFFTPKDSIASRLMPSIEIIAVRAGKDYPFTQSMISKRTIEKNNLGQDIPFLLNQLPGTVAHSDAGNGFGYTGIRIRGTDASRINFTLNGIAYNDAESQGVFLVNLPDFLSSVNSIQVQRGVGTSSNGTGAFGATINLMTNDVQPDAYATLSNSMGSYQSRKHTLKAGTGLINNQYSVDVRMSALNSEGYVDRASSDLRSFYVSAASVKENASLRLNIFSGKEKTYQAWYGVSEELLQTNRRFNSAGTEKPGDEPYNNETDNYVQTHYQLFYNLKLNKKWNFNAAAFATTGEGYYEQYKANQRYSRFGLPNPIINGTPVTRTDVIRQLWLDNFYYGTNFSFQRKDEKRELILGGGNSFYDGNHFGKLIWAGAGIPKDYTWYNLDANKNEQHAFGKWLEKKGRFSFFGDVQLRNVSYNIEGFRDNPALPVDKNWFFINPKMGVRYSAGKSNLYASYAIANKEPNRDDFEAGAAQVPKHETLQDLEAGWEMNNDRIKLGAVLYYMRYRNQLVLTGKINDVGAYARTNIPVSYRTGIELEANIKIAEGLNINSNIAMSSNRILDHTEYYDDYDAGGQVADYYKKSTLAFSPGLVGNAVLNARPAKNLELNLVSKYVSRQYMDNTARTDRSLDAYFVQDFQVNYRLPVPQMKSIELILQINNIWSTKYTPNGYTYSYLLGGSVVRNNFYYPMAERNAMVGLNLNF